MPRLVFVRHAQSENNASNARIRQEFAGDPERIQVESERARQADPGLSELGQAQAERLADALVGTLAGPDSVLVTSPMLRALETAAAVASRVGLGPDRFVCHAELYEVGGCYYAGRAVSSTTPAAIEARFPVRCVEMAAEGWYLGRTGPERGDEASDRVDGLIEWAAGMLARHETVVVVAHGDLLSRWLRRLLQVSWQRGLAFMHGNTAITTVTFGDPRPADDVGEPVSLVLAGFNDLAHLPAELRTGTEIEVWWRYAWPELAVDRHDPSAELPAGLEPALARLRAPLLDGEGKSLGLQDVVISDARSVRFVARAAGELAGQVHYDPELGRLRQLIVDPRFRGRGLGRVLVRAVEVEARQRGAAELRVHAWIEAVEFYEALGFVRVGAPVEAGPGPAGRASRPWQALVKPLGQPA